jgi:hypothetical protein
MTFNYKKYSLEKLEEWVHDSISCEDVTPQEIYDLIKGVVSENYYNYKIHTERCYELLALLNGNGKGHLTCDKDDPSPECKNAWNDFWEEHYYPEEAKDNGMRPWGHSDMEYLVANSNQYTEKELNAMCDKAASDQSKGYQEMIDKGWEMTADGFWCKETNKEDKVVKWQLPVEIDGISGEYNIQFPDDLMEAANIKENDLVEWIDRKDGSFELRKVTKPIGMEEC